MTWKVQVRGASQQFAYVVHLAHPSREPQTDQTGIYIAPHRDAILAQHFPVGAADAWAEGVPSWRLVCAPRRKPLTDDVISAFVCYDDPPGWNVGSVTCASCRRWAHVVRRHRHASAPARTEASA